MKTLNRAQKLLHTHISMQALGCHNLENKKFINHVAESTIYAHHNVNNYGVNSENISKVYILIIKMTMSYN